MSVHDHGLDDFADKRPQRQESSTKGQVRPEHEGPAQSDDLQPASPALLVAVGATLLAVLVLVISVIVWAVS